MKRTIMCCALALGVGQSLMAQSAATAPAALADAYNGEIRAGVETIVVRRSSVDDSAPVSGNMTLTGAELFARTSTIGVYARYMSGTSTVRGTSPGTGQVLGGSFTLKEARLLIGPPGLSPEVGIMQRTTSTVDTPSVQTLYRGGLRAQWEIGNSGVQVTLDGGAYFGKRPGVGGVFNFAGASAEGTLLYQAPRHIPAYVMAGWRYERFDDYAKANDERSEENSGPFFGIGFRIGGRAGLN